MSYVYAEAGVSGRSLGAVPAPSNDMGSVWVSKLWSTAERLCEPTDEGGHEDVSAVQARYHNTGMMTGRNGGRAPFSQGASAVLSTVISVMAAA